MDKYKNIDKKDLNGFREYLKKEVNLSDSTVEDYCKRIIMICRFEEITLEDIHDNIETLCNDYTEGNKKDLGAKSHNSYRSALIKFKNYIVYSNTNKQNINKKYVINLYAPTFQKQVGCAELVESSTGKLISIHPYTRSELKLNLKDNKELYRKLWETAFDAIYDSKQGTEIINILMNQDINVFIEDGVTRSMKKLF